MNSKKNLPFDGHNLGTIVGTETKKGINSVSVNPLILLVPRVGIEPTWWVTTEGF